jgi:hypothetical protein
VCHQAYRATGQGARQRADHEVDAEELKLQPNDLLAKHSEDPLYQRVVPDAHVFPFLKTKKAPSKEHEVHADSNERAGAEKAQQLLSAVCFPARRHAAL